jgi:RNA-directed DNA polymerase
VAKLLQQQSGRCAYCGLYFQHDDQVEVDHINGDRKNSRYDNLQALHGHCHDAKTREYKEHLPVGMRDKDCHTEERREAKVSCAVLEQR